MQYNVGQVIYLLDPHRNAVLPARVFEQVTKKTIEGEEEFFYVEVPGAQSLLNLSEFDGDIFRDPKDVKDHLFQTLKININTLVEKAAQDAVEKWGEAAVPVTTSKKSRQSRSKKKAEDSSGEVAALVDLGDGVVARLKE